MKQRNLSPIAAIEQLLFEKLGNTKVTIWQYCLALIVLFIIPMLIPASVFADSTYFTVFGVLIIITWMTSRLIGRQLSRTSSVDSILIYRFFAGTPWLIWLVFGIVSYFTRTTSEVDRQVLMIVLTITAVISIMHVVGIVLHLRSLKKTIRNVKKEDLFQ